jgi:hypothetical protein
MHLGDFLSAQSALLPLKLSATAPGPLAANYGATSGAGSAAGEGDSSGAGPIRQDAVGLRRHDGVDPSAYRWSGDGGLVGDGAGRFREAAWASWGSPVRSIRQKWARSSAAGRPPGLGVVDLRLVGRTQRPTGVAGSGLRSGLTSRRVDLEAMSLAGAPLQLRSAAGLEGEA